MVASEEDDACGEVDEEVGAMASPTFEVDPVPLKRASAAAAARSLADIKELLLLVVAVDEMVRDDEAREEDEMEHCPLTVLAAALTSQRSVEMVPFIGNISFSPFSPSLSFSAIESTRS